MSTHFALCLTCPEITTGRLDSSKGWLLDASSNHHHCDVIAFTDYTSLPAPIRNTILRLGAGAPVRDNDITMFKLGLDLEDRWTLPQSSRSTAPGAMSTSLTSPADARASDVSTRSPRASTPTSATPAPSSGQLALFEGTHA